MKKLLIGILTLIIGVCPLQATALTFGISTDAHYDSVSYPDGDEKITDYIADMNSWEPDFIIDIGDLVHAGWVESEWDIMGDIIATFTGDKYYVYGNHEYNLFYSAGQGNTRADWLTKTGYGSSQYSWDVGGYHIVVIDPNYNEAGDDYPSAWHAPYLPATQRTWLTNDLAGTALPTIVFCHQRLDGSGSPYVNNSSEVREILSNSGKVIAVFMGHDHINYRSIISNIYYYEIDGMQQGDYPTTAYAKVTITDRGLSHSIEIEGVGDQADYSDSVSSHTTIRNATLNNCTIN